MSRFIIENGHDEQGMKHKSFITFYKFSVTVNMKVIQDILGHADISTTMNIYTDAKMDLKQSEFKILVEFLKSIEGDNE